MATQEKLNSLSQFVKSNIDVVRKYNAGARLVKVDSNKRLQIPKTMIEEIGLTKDVVINSLSHYMEIWDKDAFKATLEELTQEEFQRVLFEKFGDKL